jgi:ribosomal protein S18 acetylase RimI-like enzyme
VRNAEERLKQMGQRLIIVDTSGLQAFAAARSFYGRCGYEQVARIADFWAEGDDKLTFRKAL